MTMDRTARDKTATIQASDQTTATGKRIYRQITGRKYLVMASLALALVFTLVPDISL